LIRDDSDADASTAAFVSTYHGASFDLDHLIATTLLVYLRRANQRGFALRVGRYPALVRFMRRPSTPKDFSHYKLVMLYKSFLEAKSPSITANTGSHSAYYDVH